MLTSLKHLDLSCNNIDNLIQLSNDLENLRNLITLNLYENSVTRKEYYVRFVTGKLPKLEELDCKKISPNLRYHCAMKLKSPVDQKTTANKFTLLKHISKLCDPLPSAVKEELLKSVMANNKNYVP
ncbi:hypothetical protein O3M35_009028 [Rhynocoris fuscipes]|uniref:Uncharacterized protein n=1 Tax=Rhynocoris fuscipes TaxID=488301 RepID=A0AAW1D516_9HEMI